MSSTESINQKTKSEIQSQFQDQKDLIFYHIMKYPIPQDYEHFKTQKSETQAIQENFSRKQKNKYLEEFLSIVYKKKRLYKSLPFVNNIYLCNSITFNALKEDSDIDLFFIVENKRLWTARLFSLIFFSLSGVKRNLKDKSKKFCLSFYITENAKNLYNISIEKSDIYLSYWIAHLVPLYEKEKNTHNKIYKSNQRIKNILPNRTPQQHIFLQNQIIQNSNKFKKILERILSGILGNIFELFLKLIRSPIVIRKSKKHKKEGRGIIINDDMLKFHLDIRKKIHFLYQIEQKKLK